MEHDILKEFPFLNLIKYNGVELVGVIQNSDEKITSFYDFNSINTPDLKELFLKFCDEWWFESNRMLPINIFIGRDMSAFKHCLRTYNTKEVEILHGQVTSLSTILKKKSKRRQVTLIRTM
jgi:hypothetical protein